MAEQNETGKQPDATGAGELEAPQPARQSNSRRKRPLILLAILVLIGVGAYTAYWFTYAQFHATADDAYVQGNIISISPQVSGTVVAIYADDTDLVHAGDVLIQLDQSNARIALDRAKANLAHTVRQVSQMFAQARQMQATVALRKTALDQAGRDYRRARQLKKVHGISTEDYQHARTTLSSAHANLKIAEQQLDAAQAAVAHTTLEQHPLVRQAEARLRQAWLDLRRTRIVAPADGYVAQRGVQLGEQVEPGSKLMAVIPLKSVWVEANFKETGLANVRIGQPVELVADLYDDYTYDGHVVGLAAGTGSAFSLLPAQNATGNWIKVVQRVPVRIAIDPEEFKDHPLRIGLSVSVDIDTHNRDGKVLADKAPTGARQATSVYQSNREKVDALIQRIVAGNRTRQPPVAEAAG